MGLKKTENSFKRRLASHIAKKGKKQRIEKAIGLSLKKNQKHQLKNNNCVIKQAIMSSIPAFSIIEWTNKKRRKKVKKLIPIFLSNDQFRSSLGLKQLVNFQSIEPDIRAINDKIMHEFTSSAKLESSNITTKNKQQNEIVKNKKSFKYYKL